MGISSRRRSSVVGKRPKSKSNQINEVKNSFYVAMDHYDDDLGKKELEEAETDEVDEFEIEQLLNMVRMPFYLEKYMVLTLMASFDCFLYHFTGLPIRLIQRLLKKEDSNQLARKKSWMERTYKERSLLFLIIASSIILCKSDTSIIYHKIKRQSTMKLYMLFNVLEMGDKMLASMGQSLLAVVLSRKGYRRKTYNRIVLIFLGVVYIIAHGYVLLYQTVALNVAVNSYSNSLLTLLLSMQFAEIKSSVLKKFDKEGLFQITIADAVERFKLLLILMIITVRNIATNPVALSSISINKTSSAVANFLSGPFISVIGSEIIVDWIKHAYITKFNRIRPQIYDKFFFITYKDHSESLRKFQDRLGLTLPTFVVVFIVMVLPTLLQVLRFTSSFRFLQSLLIMALVFCLLIVVKLVLHAILRQWEQRIQREWELQKHSTTVTEKEYVPGLLSDGMGLVDKYAREIIHSPEPTDNGMLSPPSSSPTRGEILVQHTLPASLNDKRRTRNKMNPQGLEHVARYKMVSKNIW
ncbi:hypothetical protein NCAS_0B05690 [Naumovozyma castellii]|uniref:Uncharacterized protein n=1 Tax=Naumovozyma castellii TaxID=27288 RepID=G0V9N6_NAUCA|nr:hypothetical protein NCAS_0B05690 [Naumovozyma castellii CBS 4309]CCC68653.1 hypothetical protein NCAS_0B05690 [Naumovozyma castellii CBS 4309]